MDVGSDLSNVKIDWRQWSLNDEHRVGSQIRLEFRMIDVFRFLNFPTVLSTPISGVGFVVFVVSGGLDPVCPDHNPVTVG